MKKFVICLFGLSVLFGAIPDGYYNDASGLSGTALRTALHEIIDGHTVLSYTPGVWNAFQTTDLKPNGKIWDIYSSYEYTFGVDQAGNYSKEGDVYNREHSWPKTYFNDQSPMYTDVFHLYPTDGYVNGLRSSYPYGETDSPTYTSTNGSKLGSARSGLGYSGTVFEPIDDYKGDLARTYFYMATRYYTEDGSWKDWAMADGVELKAWAVTMLLQWNEDDPVSEKELNRNDAIYALQHNRNPFIDHPEYVLYIWGGETPGGIDAPVATAPTNVDSTGFTANWDAVDNADAYKLYVSEDADFTSYLSGYGPKTMTVLYENVNGLAPETNYYYKLKAYNSSDESVFSNVITVLTLEGGGSVNPPDTGEVHTETFANFPVTGSSYLDGTFTGQDGTVWSYDQCRGDISIDGETPCLGKGRTPVASVTSGSISGGVSTLNFQYQQAYSTDVNLDVYVNDVLVATVTSSSEAGSVKESGLIAVNVEGPAVIKFIQQNSESGQVAIDNVTWRTPKVGIDPLLPDGFIIGDAYPNPFNPVCTLPITLSEGENLKISLMDVLGKERAVIYNGYLEAGLHRFMVDGRGLATGLYFIKVQRTAEVLMKKVILLK